MVYSHYPNRRGLIDQIEPKLRHEHYFPKNSALDVQFLSRRRSSTLKITRETPIASIGSCFAREIRHWLINHDYTFIQAATGPGTGAGSARYDRVYSTFGIRQELERAFGSFEPLEPYWEIEEGGESHILDPYRYTIAWSSHEERSRELEEHREAVQYAFTQAEVVIITVGQGEIWYDRRDESVFPVLPPIEVYQPDIHHFRCSTYQENLDNLRRCYELLRAHNSSAHIIVTTSPVPLKLTFSQENSVIANCAMKSMLRAVVDEFVRESDERVIYFPAYEVVTQVVSDPFTEDGRHVRRETVNEIMGLFESMYMQSDAEEVKHQEGDDTATLTDWLGVAEELRSSQEWGQLIQLLESKLDETQEIESEELRRLDLYGETCLHLGREEDARGLLSQARKLAQHAKKSLEGAAREEVNYQWEIRDYKRLNYLIALHYQSYYNLTRTFALDLAQLSKREGRGGVSYGMILMWLKHLESHDPSHALTTCVGLFEAAPQLQENAELLRWFESLVARLES